jgi:hypothetical protein
MSGPIVRTGTTPEFWKNWDNVFGGKGKKSGGESAKKAETKPAKKKDDKKGSKKKK